MTKKDDKKTVVNIFDNATVEELARLVPDVFGETAGELALLAEGRSRNVIDMIRDGLNQSFLEGTFDALGATERRTGNDERPEHSANIKIRAIIGADNYARVADAARLRGVSNLDALRTGMRWSLDRRTI